jgi:2-polyprenyl-6-methoxyphenol hydroxylase-like FAD-dependent oxidoreductase
MPSNEDRKHAIVIGGSMAGLLAARVLSDHFEWVTLLERDAFPPVGQQRRGVPQGVHTHGLLASGREVLEKLFPGLTAELVGSGAVPGDLVREGRWFHEGACLCRFPSGLEGLLLSRPFLEGAVRSRVLRISNLKVIEDCTVEGLLTDENKLRVTGVRTTKDSFTADLVVDASGRGSHSPAWLEAIGYPRPEEEKVQIAVGYSTRLFRRRHDHLNGDLAAVIPPTPEGKRGGVMLAQEGDRWTVTLIAYFGNYAPTELPGFIEFAKSLHAPYIFEVIKDAEPLCDGAQARFPASVRKRYEKIARFPKGYLVFGDAICSFNPIYGQGMSVAALETEELDRCLAEGDDRLAERFFRCAAKVVDMPWAIAVGADLRIPETIGPRNAGVNFINWYMTKLHKAAHRDQTVSLAFHRVGNLLAPPPSVMHPKVALRVLWGNLR